MKLDIQKVAYEKLSEFAYNLAKESDLVIVVGSKKSANTTHLAEILKDITRTIHIENDTELDKEILNGVKSIGITAGASTPQKIIDKVIEKISEQWIVKSELQKLLLTPH